MINFSNTRYKRYYIFAKLFIWTIFILAYLYIFYLAIFPSQYFSFDFNHPHSQRNSVLIDSDIDNNLIIYTSTAKEFSAIDVKITSHHLLPFKTKTIPVSLQKSYIAFFYPEGAPIYNQNNYNINSLISAGDSVLIVGHNKKFPIDNPLTFISFGFNWHNVQSKKNIDLSTYEKQKLFNIKDVHPTGTVFKTKETDRYFYIENKQKKELLADALQKPALPSKAILTEENGLTVKDKTLLKKGFLFSKHYYGNIKLEKTEKLIGKDYRFKIDKNTDFKNFKKIEFKFKRSVNWKNFKLGLAEIKQKLLLHYGLQKEV